jgi:hypothetical protein
VSGDGIACQSESRERRDEGGEPVNSRESIAERRETRASRRAEGGGPEGSDFSKWRCVTLAGTIRGGGSGMWDVGSRREAGAWTVARGPWTVSEEKFALTLALSRRERETPVMPESAMRCMRVRMSLAGSAAHYCRTGIALWRFGAFVAFDLGRRGGVCGGLQLTISGQTSLKCEERQNPNLKC